MSDQELLVGMQTGITALGNNVVKSSRVKDIPQHLGIQQAHSHDLGRLVQGGSQEYFILQIYIFGRQKGWGEGERERERETESVFKE